MAPTAPPATPARTAQTAPPAMTARTQTASTTPLGRARSRRSCGVGRARRVARATLALGLAGVLVLGGCGDDDGPADDDGSGTAAADGANEEGDVTDDAWPQAEGVTLEAQVAPGDGHVTIAFTITNTGDTPVAVPDPGATPDRESTLGDGTVRVSFLGPEAAAAGGGEPPPPGEGVLLDPGAGHSGTTTALTRGGDLPTTVEVCVEVVDDFQADDDGDGLVTFPYRPTSERPTVVCSGPVTVG